MARGRVRRRNGLDLSRLCSQSRNVDVGTDREPRQGDVAAQKEIVLGPLQLQIGIRQRTYSVRIADPYAFSRERESGEEAVLVGNIARYAQQASDRHGRQ